METDALFFIERDPVRVGEARKRIFDVVGVDGLSQGVRKDLGPVFRIVRIDFRFHLSVFGRHLECRDAVGIVLAVEGHRGNDVLSAGWQLECHLRQDSAVHVGICIDFDAARARERYPVFCESAGGCACHHGAREYGGK